MRATATTAARSEIKVVGQSGQISLGKSYAGKTLRLERRAGGIIVLTVVAVVPESQLWTTEEPHRTRIAKGIAWAGATPPSETDLDKLAVQAGRPRRRARASSK